MANQLINKQLSPHILRGELIEPSDSLDPKQAFHIDTVCDAGVRACCETWFYSDSVLGPERVSHVHAR